MYLYNGPMCCLLWFLLRYNCVLIFIVCLLPLEAPPSVQRIRMCCWLWLVWSFHVPSDGLAGLWSEVLLPLLW